MLTRYSRKGPTLLFRDPDTGPHPHLFSGIAIHYPVMPSFCMMSTAGSWKFPLALGVIAIIIGLLLFFLPGQSLRFIVYLFGFIAVIIGIMLFASAWGISRAGSSSFAIPLILGIVAFIIGLVSFINPGIIGAFFAVIFAILFIISGLGMLFSALFSGRPVPIRLLVAAGGIVIGAIGISILLYTDFTAELIVQMIGLFLIAAGIIALVGALLLCRRSKRSVVTEWEEYRRSGF
jgi:uncharacterized membrane protein HdeD (DUF308 family)